MIGPVNMMTSNLQHLNFKKHDRAKFVCSIRVAKVILKNIHYLPFHPHPIQLCKISLVTCIHFATHYPQFLAT